MPQIKDVFDIDKTVAEHGKKILLLGGVGSGKSRFVTEVLAKKGSVLFVTSRKAKVLEDVECSCFSEVFKWHTTDNQTLITNAKLARLVERIADNYIQDLDDFIAHFDYIVVDEVHSIATDSAYAESSASVLSFLEYAANGGNTVICMTGTPEPIQSYFDDNGWYTADYISVCDYVHPKRITLLQKKYAARYITEHCAESKIIYFVNHLDGITDMCKELIDKEILSATEMAISVSKSSEKKFFEDLCSDLEHAGDGEIIKASSERAYAHIVESKLLPDDCKILFSTSVLREGINIKNPNVVMFCENHVLSNLIQYFGRAREGATEVYIIEDSEDHVVKNNELLYRYAANAEIIAANTFYQEHIACAENSSEKSDRKHLTDHVAKNPYIYFDYIKNEYRLFDVKYREELRLKDQYFWKETLSAHCKQYGIEQRWFDNNPQKRVLLDLAKQRKQFWGRLEKDALLNLLYTAYEITAKQPQGINKMLENKGVPIRILNSKGSAGSRRHESFWQTLLLEDYSAVKMQKS